MRRHRNINLKVHLSTKQQIVKKTMIMVRSQKPKKMQDISTSICILLPQVRGREIPPAVETVRGTWVWRLTCASIFILCFRTSSSFSLTEHTRDKKASGEGGSKDCWGWRKICKTASSLVDSRITGRQQVTMARATRRRNGIPRGYDL